MVGAWLAINGQRRCIRARHGVVLATGGVAQDSIDRVRQSIRERLEELDHERDAFQCNAGPLEFEVPGFYLGTTPDLSPGSPLRAWLDTYGKRPN